MKASTVKEPMLWEGESVLQVKRCDSLDGKCEEEDVLVMLMLSREERERKRRSE